MKLKTTKPSYGKKLNKIFGQPNISIRFEQISFYRENHRSKMAVLVLKAHDTKPRLISDLIAVSASPQNVILINQSGIFWSGTSKEICHLGTLRPYEKRGSLRDKTSSFSTPTPTPPKDVQAPKYSFFC